MCLEKIFTFGCTPGAVLFNAGCIMNKRFLLNPEKNLVQIRFVVFEKNAKPHSLIPKNDDT